MSRKKKKLRFDIDPEDKDHQIYEVDSDKPKRLGKPQLPFKDITKIETATLIFTKTNPNCVTLIFRGIPHQV